MLVLPQEKSKNKGIFVEPQNKFFDEIQKAAKEFGKKESKPVKSFKVDLTDFDAPESLDEFTKA